MLVCRICQCNCDPSDLRNGVCDDCRDNQEKEQERKQKLRLLMNTDCQQMEGDIFMGKYEIRKKSKTDANIYSAIAYSDTWEWAKKISDALNIFEDAEFCVCVGNKEISSLEDAMKGN